VDDLEKYYQVRQREERPTSQLTKARQRIQMLARRLKFRETARLSANRRLAKTQLHQEEAQAEKAGLQERLKRFEQDNASNLEPVEAECRLDAGFGSYQNVALLIEMGYEVYTKSPSQQLTNFLRRQIDASTSYTRVGANAEMLAWPKKLLSLVRILWMSPWNVFTPVPRSNTLPCSIMVLTRSRKICPSGSTTTTAGRPSRWSDHK
jgi:hypothetical protein